MMARAIFLAGLVPALASAAEVDAMTAQDSSFLQGTPNDDASDQSYKIAFDQQQWSQQALQKW